MVERPLAALGAAIPGPVPRTAGVLAAVPLEVRRVLGHQAAELERPEAGQAKPARVRMTNTDWRRAAAAVRVGSLLRAAPMRPAVVGACCWFWACRFGDVVGQTALFF